MYKNYTKKIGLHKRYAHKILLIMRLTTVFLIAAIMQVSAAGFAQRVTFKQKNATLTSLFKEIKKQTGYNVVWNLNQLNFSKPFDAAFNQTPLEQVLVKSLEGMLLTYSIDEKTIVIRMKEKSILNQVMDYFKAIDVRGKIVDEAGIGIPGVTIKSKQSKKVVVTNSKGEFEYKGLDEDDVLLISYIGYKSIEIKANADLSNIVMTLTTNGLDEVTINTGYQTLPLERSTGAYGVVSEKTINLRMETNILDRLEGSVPGLFMKNGAVTIRGLATLYAEQQPMYVVDGFPYEGDINYINPSDVLSVTVLKDAAAASIYGTRAANGVIVITTRLGNASKLTVNYNSTLFITPRPDASYLNLLNSSQMVDLQQELFNMRHPDYNEGIMRAAQPKAIEALYKNSEGLITDAELATTLNRLKTLNAQPQLEDLLMQKMFKQRHSFSANGGNEYNQFNVSLNYLGNRGYSVGSTDENVNIALRDQVKIAKWLTADVGITTNLGNAKSKPINTSSYYLNMPYEVLKDENGNVSPWNYRKSAYEIDRLIGLGLFDETYNPLNELDKSEISSKNNYVRLQGGFNVKFMEGLSLDVKYQTERGNSFYKTYHNNESYAAKNMINDAATVETNGDIEWNVPKGGQIYETRGDSKSYTLRTQLNFDKVLDDKNHLTILAGAEKRATVQNSTSLHRMGYSDNNLQFLPVNTLDLARLTNTQSLTYTFEYNNRSYNNFTSVENRYVSVYANAGHTYAGKYNLTGSVRIDDSNLFGVDPKYRYIPLWSFGGSWKLSNENFMKDANWLDHLNMRLTYGLGGNVAKNVGPFLQAASEFSIITGATATQIVSPPNKALRFERTATTNLGVDFSVLKNRISGSIDVYSRKSTDLLGDRKTDPTNAFLSALINYGSMTNKGYELALNTENLRTSNFHWASRLTYSHNKNKMTEIAPQSESVYTYTDGNGVSRIGYPTSSIFNFRSAGLDPTNGTIRVFDKNGNVVTNYDQSGSLVANMNDVDGLVFGGTLLPTYTIGLTNTFNYKNLSLNVLIIANGGNVFRDAVPQVLTSSNFSQNIDQRALNFWRKPGDEAIPGTMPAPDLAGSGNSYFASLWYALDENMLKADYVKVRDISLSYNFAPDLFKNKKIASAKLTLQVQNAFHWYRNDKGLDPEAYSQYSTYSNRNLPVTPTYMIGVDFTF